LVARPGGRPTEQLRGVAGFQSAASLKAWKAACFAAGCPGLIPHDLCRTAVRNLARAGVPERVAMQMTGHKTRSIFERYNIVSESDLTAAARRLDAAYTSAQNGDLRR